MAARYPHHVSPFHPRHTRRMSPRLRLALQGCVCICVIIICSLALNTGERADATNAPQTITVAVPLATPDDAGTPTANMTARTAQITTDMTTALQSLPAVMPDSVPQVAGKVILVSEQKQWMWVYDHNKLVGSTAVTTGMPQLQTPKGMFHVLSKVANIMFYSPWPPSSPFYYTPEHINHALYFRAGGFYIHDASWRKMFGPGSNVPHTLPDGTKETGSHGCINVTVAASAWLYQWATVGTTIDITA